MKKILVMLVACALTFTSIVPAMAADINGNISDHVALEEGASFNSFEVTIDPYNSSSVEKAIVSYNIMPEVANDMREYSEKCISGEIGEGSIIYSVPIDRSSSTRTYTGYGNRRYYEEYVEYGSSVSREAEIDSGIVTSSVLERDMDLIGEYIVGTYVDEITANMYGLFRTILEDSSVGDAYEIGARLCETKTKRYTYIYEGDSLHMGSLTEKVYFYYRFTNNGYNCYSTLPETWQTPEFASNYDKIAYFSYANGGEQQYYLSYFLNGVEFGSMN